jgi:hypothetical protein
MLKVRVGFYEPDMLLLIKPMARAHTMHITYSITNQSIPPPSTLLRTSSSISRHQRARCIQLYNDAYGTQTSTDLKGVRQMKSTDKKQQCLYHTTVVLVRTHWQAKTLLPHVGVRSQATGSCEREHPRTGLNLRYQERQDLGNVFSVRIWTSKLVVTGSQT